MNNIRWAYTKIYACLWKIVPQRSPKFPISSTEKERLLIFLCCTFGMSEMFCKMRSSSLKKRKYFEGLQCFLKISIGRKGKTTFFPSLFWIPPPPGLHISNTKLSTEVGPQWNHGKMFLSNEMKDHSMQWRNLSTIPFEKTNQVGALALQRVW